MLGSDGFYTLRDFVVAFGENNRRGHVVLVVFQRDGDVGRVGDVKQYLGHDEQFEYALSISKLVGGSAERVPCVWDPKTRHPPGGGGLTLTWPLLQQQVP